MSFRLCDHPKSKRHRFLGGEDHPDYSKDLADLAETDLLEFEKEEIRRKYHQGKLNVTPSIYFLITGMETDPDNIYYKKELARPALNPTYLRHLKVVEDYLALARRFRQKGYCRVSRTGIVGAARHPCKAGRPKTRLCAQAFPELHRQYRISLACLYKLKKDLPRQHRTPVFIGENPNNNHGGVRDVREKNGGSGPFPGPVGRSGPPGSSRPGCPNPFSGGGE